MANTDRAYHQWCDQHRKMHGPCPTDSAPAVQAAVHAVASHDPSITQRETDELYAEALAEYTQPDTFGVSEKSWRDDFKAGVATWDEPTLLANVKYVVDRLEHGEPIYAAGYCRTVLLTELYEHAWAEYVVCTADTDDLPAEARCVTKCGITGTWDCLPDYAGSRNCPTC